jgi:hypothetical protein
MVKKAYFMGKIMEQQYKTGFYNLPTGGWYLGDEYIGIYSTLGSYNDEPRRYERLVRNEPFHIEVTEVEWEKGWKIRIDKEVYVIEDVVHRLDGSIEYHTNKVICMTTIA